MRSLLVLASLALVSVAHAQTTAEVLAVQVSRLPFGPFGAYEGKLPDRVNSFQLGVQNWNAGTAVLLRLPAPQNGRIAPTAPRLLSFADDAGRDLTKIPEGAPLDDSGRRKPISFEQNAATGELFIVIASMRAPSPRATRLAGEIELDLAAGAEAAKESQPVQPRAGEVAAVAPFTVKITGAKKREPGEERKMHPEAPAWLAEQMKRTGAKDQPQDPGVLVSFDLVTDAGTTWRATKIEAIDSEGKTWSFDVTPSATPTTPSYSITVQKPNPIRFRVTAINTGAVQSVRVKFQTALGVGLE